MDTKRNVAAEELECYAAEMRKLNCKMSIDDSNRIVRALAEIQTVLNKLQNNYVLH